MSQRDSVFSNTLFSSVSVYVEYFLGLVTSILVARYLGPGEFGVYGLIIWLSGTGVALINAGIASGTIKFLAELRGSGQTHLLVPLVRHLRRIQRVTMIVTLTIGAIVFFVAGKRLAPDINLAGFGLLLLSIALRAPYMLNIAIAKGSEDFRATATIAAMVAPLNLAFIAAAILMHASLEGFVTVYALVSVAFFAISTWQVHRHVRAPETAGAPAAVLPPELRARMRRYLVLAMINLFVAFFSASGVEVLFLNLWSSPADAGQFRAAYQLASSASLLVPGVFAATLLPFMARSLGEGREFARRRFVLSTVHLTILAAPVAAFGIVFSGAIMAALYGPAYLPAATALSWNLAACALTSATAGAASLLISADRQGSVLALSICNGLIKTTIGIYLTMKYGLAGAVASFAIVAVFNSATQFWLAMRIAKASLPWGHILRILLVAAVATLPGVVVSLWMRPWPTLIIGGPLFGIAYVFGTFAAGCWDRQTVDYIRQRVRRLAGDDSPLDAALAWAHARSRENSIIAGVPPPPDEQARA